MFYQKILKQNGIMVISVEEKFDSSPEGHLFSLITAGINEYYSKHLAKRSFAGVMQNARKGIVIGGIPPLGFDVDANKRYVINQKEAESVRIIFEKILEGWSHSKIRDYLNENGYLTKRGVSFSDSFYEILRNRKYIGEYIFNYTTKKKSRGPRNQRENNEDDIIRIPGGLPQIIDTETFDKVQHFLNKRKNSLTFEFRPTKYLMSGRLECGYCGSSFSGGSSYAKKKNIPYAYYGHANFRQGRCEAKDTRVQYIDNWIKQFVISDFISMKDLSERTKDINRQIMNERSNIQEQIKRIQQNLTQMQSLLGEKAKQIVSSSYSVFALEDTEEAKKEIAKQTIEQKRLERRLETLQRISSERLTIVIRKFKDKWKEFDNPRELKEFIHELLSRVVITNEVITAYINYDTLSNKLCDFDIEIASIGRNKLMKIWR